MGPRNSSGARRARAPAEENALQPRELVRRQAELRRGEVFKREAFQRRQDKEDDAGLQQEAALARQHLRRVHVATSF